MNDKVGHKAGARLGAYEIVRTIGRGGMAFIYEARHTALEKRVAIKVLYEHLASSPIAAARFEREGRAAARIRHPNVVETFEVGHHDGTPYLVMELLEGTDLADHLTALGSLSASEAIDVLLPAIAGVAAAHAAGVVHRDLKPSNIYLARERRSGVCSKVVDFGISKLPVVEENGLTKTEMLLGTAEYMAPEHARSPKNADARSDQYALGAILYECLTGRRPFGGEGTYDLLHAIVTAPLPSPRSIVPGLPPLLEAAILKAMHREPSRRYDSVEELGHALVPFASEPVRASWRSEFATGGEGGTSNIVHSTGIAQTVSVLGTTLDDSPPQDVSAPAKRWSLRALVAAATLLAAVLSTALLVWNGVTRSAGDRTPSANEGVVANPPRVETPWAIDASARSVSVGSPPAAAVRPGASLVTSASEPARILPSPQMNSAAREADGRSPRAPPPSTNTAVRPHPAATTAASRANCTPPFTFDASGTKVWKQECF